MTAQEKWISLGFEKEVNETIKLRKINNIPNSKIIVDCTSKEKCIIAAENEAKYNWINYFPDDNCNGPAHKQNTIKLGKLLELLFVYKYKKYIVELPTIYSATSFAEYDMIIKSLKYGSKQNNYEIPIEIKTTASAANKHILEYPSINVFIPKNIPNINKFIYIKNNFEKIEFVCYNN